MVQDFLAPVPPDRRQGKLRFGGRRLGRGDAVHRGPDGEGAGGAAWSDLDKETVEMLPNYDGCSRSRASLPSGFPTSW